jgi:hypothetical protein
VINVLPWPGYRKGKGPLYAFSGKLGGSQNRSGICGEEKDFLSLAGIDPLFQWRTQEFCSGGEGGSTNSVEDREKGDLGAVGP